MNTEIEFPGMQQVIIATKGLPCTGKSEIAALVSEWGRCPVVYIDDYLDALSLEKGHTADDMPSDEEAERVHHRAIDALYKAALRRQRFQSFSSKESGVVVKSRLRHTFEIDKLIQLATQSGLRNSIIIVIECQMKNEHRFRLRLESRIRRFRREGAWYKAMIWKDLDEAKLDSELADQSWEDYLVTKIKYVFEEANSHVQVIRLVLDPFDDLNVAPADTGNIELTPAFRDVINYLLSGWGWDYKEEGSFTLLLNKHQYVIVQFNKVRRYLVEKALRAASSQDRTENLCVTNDRHNCVFKLCSSKVLCCCGACEKQVAPGPLAYACYFCILTLHKSCAEQTVDHQQTGSNGDYYPYRNYKPETRDACKSCTESGVGFSRKCKSCIFQTLLKDEQIPTIINHESHGEHVVSMQIILEDNKLIFNCKACGDRVINIAYGCYICQVYHHFECVFLPAEVEHEHGGYKHVMKLMYTHDSMEEESYWCDSCYKDMDPQFWFYFCKDCPYYIAHPGCVLPHYKPE